MVDLDRAVVARARVAYLARVRAGLHLTDSAATEVIEELAAHVADATEGLRAEGLSEEQAEREALARLGSPDALADEIRRAHQTTRRALAAAGAGVVAATTSGFYGLVLGVATVMLGWVALWIVLSAASTVVGDVRPTPGDSTGTALGAWTWAVAAYFGARGATRRIALTSRRSIVTVRRKLAMLFGVAAAATTALQPVLLDEAALIAMALIPAAAAAGALRATEQETVRNRRTRLFVTAVILVGAVGVPLAGMVGPTSVESGVTLGEPMTFLEFKRSHDERYGAMGTIGDDVIDLGGGFILGGSMNEADLSLPASLAGWSDLRLEAWLRDPVKDELASGVTAPFAAVAIPSRPGPHRISLDAGHVRDVGAYVLVVAGTSPDGTRVVLNGPMPRDGIFHGSILDWLRAPSARP